MIYSKIVRPKSEMVRNQLFSELSVAQIETESQSIDKIRTGK
jgi:DNA-binding protein